jgi:anti-sigma factor (TIGR02949 family)
MRELVDYLKGEVPPDAADRIREHLAKCRPCEGEADFEERLLSLLETRLRGERCPDRLKARIREALDALEADPGDGVTPAR